LRKYKIMSAARKRPNRFWTRSRHNMLPKPKDY
jgi:hypothetical protein